MTLEELITAWRRLINEETASFFSDAEGTQWLEQGAKDFALHTECIERTTNITSVENQAEYTMPSDFIVAVSVFYDGAALRKGNVIGQTIYDQTGTEVTTPYFYRVRNRILRLFPASPDAGKTITVEYAALPLTAADIPAEYQDAIIVFAVMRAMEKDKEDARANRFWQQYLGLREQTRRKVLQLRGGDQITFQDGGFIARQTYWDEY